MADGLAPAAGWVPVPDPTTLTTEQLRRELASLREILETRLDGMDRATQLARDEITYTHTEIGGVRDRLREETSAENVRLRELIEARLDGMDRAIRLHAEIIDRLPADRDQAISHLAGLHDTKFAGIALQFAERDTRTDQATESAKQALDAALLAQKELVAQQNEANAVAAAKAEASFTKQIDQIGTIIQTLEKALDARITELKERIDRGEGSGQGAAGQRTETRQVTAGQQAVIGLLLAAAAIIVTILLATGH